MGKLEDNKKLKISADRKIIIIAIVLFIISPFVINVVFIFMDIIYNKFGIVLTAQGLYNENWLEFWKDYLPVAITCLSIYLVWDSANKDRKERNNKDEAEQYLSYLSEEKHTLVEVSQCFNIGIIYRALYQFGRESVQDSKAILEDARDKIDGAHIKFEMLTDLSDDFERYKSNSCIDIEIMQEIRDIFYDMEGHYIKMINIGEDYINKMAAEQQNIEKIGIYEKLIINLRSQISYMQNINHNPEEIYSRQEELRDAEQQLIKLRDLLLSGEEKAELLKPVIEQKDYLEQTRPRFNRYCKTYFDLKRSHASDLRNNGIIQYIRKSDMIQ